MAKSCFILGLCVSRFNTCVNVYPLVLLLILSFIVLLWGEIRG